MVIQNTSINNRDLFLLLLQITCFCVFAGRAWEHLFWNPPYRVIIQDLKVVGWLTTYVIDMTPAEFFASKRIDASIVLFMKFIGVVYAACAISILFVSKKRWYLRSFLFVGFGLLIIIALIIFYNNINRTGMLIEYALQTVTPLLLYLYLKNEKITPVFVWIALIATAFTFIGHGMYASGYYPVPGPFMDMTIGILGVDNATAKQILYVAGILDYIVAIGIFIPIVRIPSLYWAFIWGFVTALARLWNNIYWFNIDYHLHQWVWEFFIRIPHFSIPLLLIFYFRSKGR